jgi:DNA polymerase III delta prime subunit
MRLYEKYRPKDLSEVVGQEKAVRACRFILEHDQLGGSMCWVYGPSGTGKTTLARILAQEFTQGGEVTEIDAQDVTLDFLRDTERRWGMCRPMFGTGTALIVNEAHGLRSQVVSRWLTTAEKQPSWVTVIFTTTVAGQLEFDEKFDACPFGSRVKKIRTSNQGFNKPFAARAKQIAEAEGMDGQAIEVYEKRLYEEHNNARALLELIAGGGFAS